MELKEIIWAILMVNNYQTHLEKDDRMMAEEILKAVNRMKVHEGIEQNDFNRGMPYRDYEQAWQDAFVKTKRIDRSLTWWDEADDSYKALKAICEEFVCDPGCDCAICKNRALVGDDIYGRAMKERDKYKAALEEIADCMYCPNAIQIARDALAAYKEGK